MDSLLASYASSDDEEEESEHPQNHQIQPEANQPKESIPKANLSSSSSSSLFSALPPPKSASSSSTSSSLFSALPQPKSSSSLFSSLSPPTNTNNLNPQILPEPDPEPKINPPKKVVQFRPPVNPYLTNSKNFDDDEDDEDDKDIQSKNSSSLGQSTSVKSFLSSMLPAPKNSGSLGSLPSASGTGRRSILEADTPPASSTSTAFMTESKTSATTLAEDHGVEHVNQSFSAVEYSSDYSAGSASDPSCWSATNASYVGYDGSDGLGTGATDPSSWSTASGSYENYCQGYYGHSESGDYGAYGYNYVEGSAPPVTPQMAPVSELKISGKRGRNDIPQEIMEVNQDDLMKNRPREDQTKLTGIAFGPSYQPASTKGKPSKLLKRKHQIGSLYYDMKQKEMELAERRSRGLLTKAETQAKYGW